ncbi:putative AfsR family transcriptional regulator [Gordonia soli NBRC 108243]|uniref:Putative AfsR family transcriptional regulator n=1 Tax=Gordonia soli NBRC 108243 TaxID=1223545 RepID=M0QPG5_9ACTN|nr:putative AfsR family transcriptional regulator [Gordonia soli NBRC 108243]
MSDLREVPGTRAKRLLAALALAGGRVRSADRLIDDVWGDEPPGSPQSALHTQISRLRHALPPGVLEAHGSGYRLTTHVLDLDVVGALVAEGSAAALVDATRWWRGEPGDDLGVGSPVGEALVERVRALRDSVDRRRTAQALADGDPETAREIAERRCARDPLDESAHADLMRSLAATGRTADALDVFARLRRRLSADLGVDPGVEIAALHVDLLAGAGGATSIDRGPTGRTTWATTTPASRRSIGLRSATSELIGRDGEVDAIVDHLDLRGESTPGGRVVTVLGPGGVGKTRIATEVGHRALAAGVSVYYVPLASVRADEDVVVSIAAALGVGETELTPSGRPRMAPGDLTARLEDVLRGRITLLILDNCEQIIDGCARVVADLVAGVDRLRVLTTSRTPLAIGAERVHPLPVLQADAADAPAVELFGLRATAVRPDVPLPREQVADLCRRLDGLPLAIELAAARVRTMSVGEIADRLSERFALLRSGDRTAPDRHRTLSAVIEWSWELLDDTARETLIALCRFPDGFSRSAAAAVTGLSGIALDDALEDLLNQSLLAVGERAGATRFRMLEMVREFGEARQDDAAAHEVVTRMGTWAVDLVNGLQDRAENGDHSGGLTGLGAEADNLVWILRQAIEPPESVGRPDDAERILITVFPGLSYFWTVRGLHGDTRSWGKRVVEALPSPPQHPDETTREHWQITTIVGILHSVMTQDLRVVARARTILRQLHRPASANSAPGEFMAAIALSRNEIAGYRIICEGVLSSNQEVRTLAVSMRSNSRENRGLIRTALADSTAWGRIAEGSRYAPWFRGMWHSNTASLYGQQGRYAEAAELYGAGVELLDDLGADEDARQVRAFYSLSLLADGRPDESRRQLEILTADLDLDADDPQGNPEIIGPALLCRAEALLLADGPGAAPAAAFRRAADVILDQHPLGTADPSVLLVVSGTVAGLVCAGHPELARGLEQHLVGGVDSMVYGPGWQDLPQVGAAALAVGALRSASTPGDEVGARLLELAHELPARQDYPSLGTLWRTTGKQFGGQELDSENPVARHRSMPRHRALAEIRRLLSDCAPDGHALRM